MIRKKEKNKKWGLLRELQVIRGKFEERVDRQENVERSRVLSQAGLMYQY